MKRKIIAAARAVATALLCLWILVMVAGIAYNHPARIDLTSTRINTLSPETRGVLGRLTEPIDVVLAYRFLPLLDRADVLRAEVFGRARAMLREYALLSSKIRIVADIDVNARGVEWEKAKKRYNLAGWNRVSFIRGRTRQDVRLEEMAEIEKPRGPRPGRILRTTIEKAFTSAIKRLAVGERRKVYFLLQDPTEGIVPPSIDDTRPGGLSTLREELEASNYEVRTVRLRVAGEVPDDCAALWIVAPLPSFTDDEIRALGRYLERGGRIVAAVHPAWRIGGLGPLLERWGARVEEANVVRRVRDPFTRSRQIVPEVPIRNPNPFHPVTRRLPKDEIDLYLTMARPITTVDTRLARVEPLLDTERSRDIWGERGTNARMDAGDIPSPMHVAVAIRGRPKPDGAGPEARLVVFGSHTFLTNGSRQYPAIGGWFHRDIALNALYWVQGREDLVAIEPREGKTPRIPMGDEKVANRLYWSSIFLVPGLAIALGLVVWAARRH